MFSNTTKPREASPENKKPAFKATTRCDQCGAQAYIKAEKWAEDGIAKLFFCIHHGDKSQQKLKDKGFLIDDRRWALN